MFGQTSPNWNWLLILLGTKTLRCRLLSKNLNHCQSQSRYDNQGLVRSAVILFFLFWISETEFFFVIFSYLSLISDSCFVNYWVVDIETRTSDWNMPDTDYTHRDMLDTTANMYWPWRSRISVEKEEMDSNLLKEREDYCWQMNKTIFHLEKRESSV